MLTVMTWPADEGAGSKYSISFKYPCQRTMTVPSVQFCGQSPNMLEAFGRRMKILETVRGYRQAVVVFGRGVGRCRMSPAVF